MRNITKSAGRFLAWFWPDELKLKFFRIFLAFLFLLVTSSYGVSQWYMRSHQNQPLTLGATFIPSYAKQLGLDPNQTLEAMLKDLKLKQVRLVSYWDDIEPEQGKYDFSMLDSEFALAQKYGTKVSLAVGLRQPRWPECHQPSWVNISDSNKTQWNSQLYKFINSVVNRYKDNSALSSYELENEFFMKVFGTCSDFDRDRLVSEYKMLKAWDPNHKVIISRSDNWIGIPLGQPRPDEFAISIYKRVWDSYFTHRYFEYPLPPWFYGSLAGWTKIFTGRDMVVHELQAEPWPPKGQTLATATLDEQFKSMNADILRKRFKYAEDTGMRTIDLWGAEWWYWLKEKQNDPSVWNVVKQAVAEAELQNSKLAK